ncbi:MAG: U32 family peptidase [Bacteroidaceae bacterium]|nr:U32 family peptidase [Bacteroidaceae bacterium]
MSHPRKMELLAPARNVETAIAAIDSGADAVYIGAAQFGARQAAGNTVEDIVRLVEYAHIFGVKVYVTLNTILTDEEIEPAEQLITELYNAGVDALIVQDFAITKMNIPPIQLHCSTQMDNCTVEKVRFLAQTGFPRVVLARELSLQQIAEIHKAVPHTELEVFVHGALCVSYSGRCYASQHCFGRSANRGACAQFCRLPFTLVDADGNVIKKDKHLLSLKDMNRSAMLEEMLDAGVTSLKIEGRLKDSSYVKNITAYYRRCLDDIFARRACYTRASYGSVAPHFTPSPAKSFNRGFTNYFLDGKRGDITSFDTPKSIGEYVGRVKFVSRSFFTVTGGTFNNGDGACFIAPDGKLQGFHINKAEGNRVFPQNMPALQPGTILYRNYDCEFERTLSRPLSPRRLSIALEFAATPAGFSLTATTESGITCTVDAAMEKEEARAPQQENINTQLKKWGNTPFEASSITVGYSENWFVPSSLLSDMRRRLCDTLVATLRSSHQREPMQPIAKAPFVSKTIDYTGNVSNSLARAFYTERGVQSVAPAYELQPSEGSPIMYCKHCIKYSMGWCTKTGEKSPYKEPYYLVSADGRRFRLHFNCKECMMTVVADK